MTIKELVYKCKDVLPSECGEECPYAKECKAFRKIVYASIIPQSLEPILTFLDSDFITREV